MGGLSENFNAAPIVDVNVANWKDNNPEGYARACAQEKIDLMNIVDASRYEEGKPALSKQERADYHTSDNPNEIRLASGHILGSLGPKGLEYRDDLSTVATNLDMANHIHDAGNAGSDGLDMADALIERSQQICEKYDLDPAVVAENNGLYLVSDMRNAMAGERDPVILPQDEGYVTRSQDGSVRLPWDEGYVTQSQDESVRLPQDCAPLSPGGM